MPVSCRAIETTAHFIKGYCIAAHNLYSSILKLFTHLLVLHYLWYFSKLKRIPHNSGSAPADRLLILQRSQAGFSDDELISSALFDVLRTTLLQTWQAEWCFQLCIKCTDCCLSLHLCEKLSSWYKRRYGRANKPLINREAKSRILLCCLIELFVWKTKGDRILNKDLR